MRQNRAGGDADVLILNHDSLDLLEVIARGRRMVGGGELMVTERFLEGSSRRINLDGRKQR